MLRRLGREEDGVALVLALFAVFVLACLTAAVLAATALNHRNALVSADDDHAFALAETGLAYGEGRLYSAATSGQSVLVPQTTFSQDGGTVTYVGSLSGSTWTITGTGTYNGVTRSVSAQASVPAPQQEPDPTIWNYMYTDSTTAPCATQYSGSSATITVPLYSRGNICLSGSSIKYNGADLEVGGNFDFSGSSFSVGSKSAPISKMNVVGSCAWTPCDTSHGIWVATPPGMGHTLDPVLTMPVVDFQGLWKTTNPGPNYPCPAGSGVPTPFFDNDASTTTGPNNSLGTINLFPSGVSYDCKVGSNELKWNGATKTLLVNGSFYFDGNINISGSSLNITYSGRGTIYASGTISVSGSSVSLCGASPCSAWNPNQTDASGNYVGNELIFVAGCYQGNTSPTSPQTVSGTCTSISGSSITWQVGTLTEGAVTFSGSSIQEEAPIIALTADLSGSSLTQMLPFHGLPPGAPSDTTLVTPPPTAPSHWNG